MDLDSVCTEHHALGAAGADRIVMAGRWGVPRAGEGVGVVVGWY
jgi:hypothetical protein